MHLRNLDHIDSHAAAARFLGGRSSKNLAHNTTMSRQGDGDISVRYHWTDIVTYHTDGTITINDGGWGTSTTIRRLHALTPGHVRIRKESGYDHTVYRVMGDIERRIQGPTRIEV